MNIIFSILLVFFIILLLAISSACLESYQQKHKVKFAETIIDKICSLIDSKLESVTGQSEAGPWFLVVYTQDSNYPIWVSNNNIRSVHPDPENRKIVIKQFCNEDMVIENVISYELCSGNDLCEYDM